MAALRLLVVASVCLYFSYFTVAQQCDQAIQDFQKCVKDSVKKPGQGQGRGQGQGQTPPNFDEIKQKANQCFTSNNCEAPKFDGPPGSKPEGGRAGRVGGATGANGDNRKCFETVTNKTKDAILTCIRKTDPSFSFPTGDHKGPGAGFGGPGGPHGGFGGPGGPGGHGPGGPGGPGGHGPGGPGGPGGAGGQQFLLEACKNNADAAKKLNACLADVFPHPPQKPNNDQFKQVFEEHCKAKSACEAKLGASCKAVLEKRHEAMCTCGQEVASKHEDFFKQEPSCANVQQPTNKMPARQGEKHDCSKKPQDPCTQGFEAFQQSRDQHH